MNHNGFATESKVLSKQETSFAHDDLTSPEEIMTAIADGLDADIFLYSGDMEHEGAEAFINIIEDKRQRQNAVVVLTTYGGDADAAYIIARHIKRCYEKFYLFVFGYCKSAGTLLALGADEIIMSHNGEFGPLDVQVAKADEIGFRNSGLDISQALESLCNTAFRMFEQHFLELKMRSSGVITTRTAGEIASSLTVGLLSPITAQIDPIRIGEIHRAINIAHDYGLRLNTNANRVGKLIRGYPTHSFVIDFEEASNLFENVRKPTELETLMVFTIQELFEKETGFDCVKEPHPDTVVAHLNPNVELGSMSTANENCMRDQNDEEEL